MSSSQHDPILWETARKLQQILERYLKVKTQLVDEECEGVCSPSGETSKYRHLCIHVTSANNHLPVCRVWLSPMGVMVQGQKTLKGPATEAKEIVALVRKECIKSL